MSRLATRFRTLRALGFGNILRVLSYRAQLRLGRYPAEPASGTILPTGPMFLPPALPPTGLGAPHDWTNEGLLFSHHPFPLGDAPPAWLVNPFTGEDFPDRDRPWFRIGDFDPRFGDIKLAWELSRFSWALPMAQRAREGSGDDLDRLNRWIDNWTFENPPYRGPNWKCAQEAGIRVMHLAMVSLLLGHRDATPRLAGWLDWHLRRIAPTMAYARAQDNNHGTSEAAALFIGGAWLARSGHPHAEGWARRGRAALEERCLALIAPDGSFSQHSLTYHRMMLDTLSMAELWRRALDLPPFSASLTDRATRAAGWLHAMIFSPDGDGPNLGANDGAQLLPMSDTPYRDFRPSCALALTLFADADAFGDDVARHARWFGIDTPSGKVADEPAHRLFDAGGYAVLRQQGAVALLRYPRFRYRPSQDDVMHVDLWIDGEAILRDGGTYSYNDGDAWVDYFGGIAGHNSIEFDGREPMPRLGRFLLGDWLDASESETGTDAAGRPVARAAYRDRHGALHRRTITLAPGEAVVVDEVSGLSNDATIRWRLRPGEWHPIAGGVAAGGLSITIEGDFRDAPRIVAGHESLFYREKRDVPVLVATAADAGTILTRLRWAA